jgi:hypothetical protein
VSLFKLYILHVRQLLFSVTLITKDDNFMKYMIQDMDETKNFQQLAVDFVLRLGC